MAVKTVYSSKDEIPEGLEEYYTERDGKFRFDANDYETDAEVENLKKALRKERDNVSELESKVKSIPDDFDSDKWDALKHIDPEDANSKGDEALLRQIDNLKDQVTSLKGTVKEKEQVIEEKGSKYQNTLQRADIKSALASAGVTDEIYLETATDRVMSNQRIQSVEDNGTYQTRIGDMDEPVDKWAKEWVDTDEGKRFATAENNFGGGSRNNGGTPKKYPKSKNDFNDKQKREYVSEHGLDSFKQLPDGGD